MKNTLTAFFACVALIIINSFSVPAQGYIGLMAKSGILMEESTGKVLYGKFEDERIYPASMTKVLTLLVMLDWLEPGEVVTVGAEINQVPPGSSMAGNFVGESLVVENLARLIIIPSGNESSNVAAMATALKASGLKEMPFKDAEAFFCGLMNQRAKEIGAINSNFANAHGYHDPNHYTTAYDMAIICREAMKNDLIRQIVKETAFVGNGAGSGFDTQLQTKEYDWSTHNDLLRPDSGAYYSSATGIKTGWTDEAGECLAASAEKDEKNLIAVICDSPSGMRWTDAVNLFEYGFNYYSFETVQNEAEILEAAGLENSRLGEPDTLEVISGGAFTDFLTKEEFARIKREIIYNSELIANAEAGEALRLKAPIAKGDELGVIIYKLDDAVIYEDAVLASRDVNERTLQTDALYYLNYVKSNALSLKAIPYWICAAIIISWIISRIRGRRSHGYPRLNRR